MRVAPNGDIDGVVEMPVNNVTTCTFGGKEQKRCTLRVQQMEHYRASDWLADYMRSGLRSADDRRIVSASGLFRSTLKPHRG